MSDWFIVNIADAPALEVESLGKGALFEESIGTFEDFGINVRVLEPRQPSSRYHRENAQEAFLVLAGGALAIVEGEEREMAKGDFLHIPPGVAHAILGGPEGGTVLMVGARKGEAHELEFPQDDAIEKHGIPTAMPEPRPTKLGEVPW